MRSVLSLGEGKFSSVVLAGACLVLCLLPAFVSNRFIFLFAEVIIWILFSLSYNLMLGHTGMLSFGHAAFFGAGAYTFAVLATKAHFPFALAFIAAPVLGLFLSLLIGYFSVRLTHLYFSFLTFAFGQMIFAIIYRWYDVTGGGDGLLGIPVPAWLSSTTRAYYFALALTFLSLLALLRLTNSPLGAVFHAIRDNPERVGFSGLKVLQFRLACFAIAGVFGATAGALYAILIKAAFIEYVGLEIGVIPLFACLLGGMHTFYGPIIGAIIVVALDKLLGAYTSYWATITGVAVILIVLFFPKGILEYLKQKTSTLFAQKML